MTEEIELVYGSGNVFRDFGDPDPGLRQARAVLAAAIIKVLDARGLSVRAAEKLTGVAASEFSRIRNVELGRFTIDRMMKILGKLGQEVELTVEVWPRREDTQPLLGRKAREPGRSAGRGKSFVPENAHGQAARRRSPAKRRVPVSK
jgi:predicted XRE-type DNA-binding protein